jgi:phosphatidylserine/phosphatidylglycerophosphate/cardiolipin synthase-like enzyme
LNIEDGLLDKTAMLVGSSNFSEAGFLKNIEWNYFTPGNAGSQPGNDDPFSVGCRAFEGYRSIQAVDVTDDFLSAYRRRWEKQQDSTGGQRTGEEVFEKTSSWNARVQRTGSVQDSAERPPEGSA